MDRQPALLTWFATAGRDLPWRRTRDPWAVLVSEVMLQQTQVARVRERYPGFLARFPTPDACAAAPAGDVVAAWHGLGYNRRAVNLHRAALVVAEAGGFCADLAWLRRLPGVGAYTARAVLALAFGRDVGVVDTNVARALARWAGTPYARPADVQADADAAVPPGGGWAWNQALFDLGATVCTKRSPACGACPVAPWCGWAMAGRPDPDPASSTAGSGRPQSRFEGSDRQGRGRLVAALRLGSVAGDGLAAVMGWPDDPARAARVAAGVVADGLADIGVAEGHGGVWRLAGHGPAATTSPVDAT